jgi:hypothetical protein
MGQFVGAEAVNVQRIALFAPAPTGAETGFASRENSERDSV